MRVPEVVSVCVPVMVNHGVPVGACVRACVCAYNRKRGSILRSPVYAVHRSFLLSVQWVPARPLVVGRIASGNHRSRVHLPHPCLSCNNRAIGERFFHPVRVVRESDESEPHLAPLIAPTRPSLIPTVKHGSQLLYARTTVRSERKLDHSLTL